MRSIAAVLLFFTVSVGAADALKLYTIDGQKFARFTEFLKLHRSLKGGLHPLTLVAEINYGRNSVRFAVGERFYISNGEQYSLRLAPVYRKGYLYMPEELAEEVISEFSLPLKYTIKKDKVVTDRVEAKVVPQSKGLDFIVIDPGHGGHDPGALGHGFKEKDIVLPAAKKLFYRLKKEFPGTRIYITRFNDNVFLELKERADIANSKMKVPGNGLGLFISLHANATLSPEVNGYEIFYLAQNASNESAREVMLRENRSRSGNIYVRALESGLINAQIQAESKVLARQVHKAFLVHLDGLVSSRGVRKADFAVLRWSLMPAILIEMGYVTNKNEAGLMRTEHYRKKFSDAVVKGIRNFIKNRPGI